MGVVKLVRKRSGAAGCAEEGEFCRLSRAVLGFKNDEGVCGGGGGSWCGSGSGAAGLKFFHISKIILWFLIVFLKTQ